MAPSRDIKPLAKVRSGSHPPRIKDELEFIGVSHMTEVLKLALEDPDKLDLPAIELEDDARSGAKHARRAPAPPS